MMAELKLRPPGLDVWAVASQDRTGAGRRCCSLCAFATPCIETGKQKARGVTVPWGRRDGMQVEGATGPAPHLERDLPWALSPQQGVGPCSVLRSSQK